jgi:hypothetical protein
LEETDVTFAYKIRPVGVKEFANMLITGVGRDPLDDAKATGYSEHASKMTAFEGRQ